LPLTVGDTSAALPDKPSNALLPFTNIGGDPDHDYFADGIVEDIITELSRFQRLFVIARNTSFTYRGRSVDVKAVARELGVHFVLEGSVRKAGDRVRVTAQLIDGGTGRHVWAERYEDVLADVFELQERVTRQIVASLVPEIVAEEMRLLERGQRRFTEVDEIAWRASKAFTDALFRGEPALMVEAIRLAEQAIERDRNCRLAWSVLSGSHVCRVFFGWAADRAGALNAARRAADMLLTLAPNDSQSYFARGGVEFVSGNSAAAAGNYRRAHDLNPNDAMILFFLSLTEAMMGNAERAKVLAAQALRLSPKDRWVGAAHLALAMSAFVEQDLAGLRKWAELAIQSHPTAPIRRVLMIVYAIEVVDTELLYAHLEKLKSVAPDFIPSLFRGDFRPFYRPEHVTMLLDTLRKAGLAGPNATS
jgi:TolB-like protein